VCNDPTILFCCVAGLPLAGGLRPDAWGGDREQEHRADPPGGGLHVGTLARTHLQGQGSGEPSAHWTHKTSQKVTQSEKEGNVKILLKFTKPVAILPFNAEGTFAENPNKLKAFNLIYVYSLFSIVLICAVFCL